jgi:integrase
MPSETLIQRRDRAVVAFVILTGARDSAVASMQLKDVDLTTGRVFQDARHVRTKRAKTFTSVFFPVGDFPRRIVVDWIFELRSLLFGPDEPIFPATAPGFDDQGLFRPHTLLREPWASAAPIRTIFKRSFEAAGFPYANPHSLRRTLVRLSYDLNLSQREQKAWSQNLGHDSIVTTSGYGPLSLDEQADVMATISPASESNDDVAALAELAAKVARQRRG